MMKNSPKGRIGEYSSSLNIRNGFRRRGGIRPNFSTGKFSKKLIGLNFSTENLKPLHHEPQLVSLNSPRTINSLNSSSNLITFHFLSNWGSPDFLSVRHISIIGSKYQPIPITSISSISEPKLESNLKTLFHKPGIKTTEEFTWEIPWSPTSQFTIICYIPKKSEAQIIRIWNPITHCESGVCDVEIKFNSTEIFCGQVPKAFVIDIPIPHHITTDKNNAYSQAKDILLEAFPSLKPHPRFSDKWGTYPIRPAESISFEVVSTFEGGNMFGINAIDIFDEHGKIIKWNDIKEVIIENCTNYKDPKLLFMKNKDSNDPHFMFIGKSTFEKNPIVKIIFNKQIYPALILFYNYNAERLKIGVEKLRVRTNNDIAFTGKVEMANGSNVSKFFKIYLMEKGSNPFLTDNPNICL